MKLSIKIVAWLLVANVILLAIDGYLSVRGRLRFVERDTERDTLLLGQVTRALLADVWRMSGEQRALQLIRDANAADSFVQIRWALLQPDAPAEYRPAATLADLRPLQEGRSVTIRKRIAHQEPYSYTYFPISLDDSHQAAIELAESLGPVDSFARAAVLRTASITLILILFSAAFIGFIGVRFVGRPLQVLKEKAGRVGRGDLSGPILLAGNNELAELAQAMNQMCEQLTESNARLREETEGRLKALEALRHADRLKTLGRLAAGVAHEVGTPLNVIGGRAAMLKDGNVSQGEIRENARIIKTQTDRITALVHQLLEFARRRAPQRVETVVADLVRETVLLLEPQANKRSIRLVLSVSEESLVANIDPSQIQQVLMNIILNAIQAMTESGPIEIRVGRARATPPPGQEGVQADYLQISVQDHGPGISEENMRHVFEPFFTTKQVGEGTGLGLPIAYGIVQEHAGWIDVQSQEGRGSRFTVHLPLRTAKALT